MVRTRGGGRGRGAAVVRSAGVAPAAPAAAATNWNAARITILLESYAMQARITAADSGLKSQEWTTVELDLSKERESNMQNKFCSQK